MLESNQLFITVYGVGSGNAPALSNCSVGHLWTVFHFLKTISYVIYQSDTRRTHERV